MSIGQLLKQRFSLMKKLLLLTLLLFSVHAYAEQKYNPYSNEWETVMPDTHI